MKKETTYEEPLRDDQTLLISVSGGKDSAAMAIYFLKEAKLPNKLRYVFADTGWEHPDTYEYIETLEKCLEIKIERVKGDYDVPPNPLYLKGATRVGCYPCIMCKKSELAFGFKENDLMYKKLKDAEDRVTKVSTTGVSSFLSHDKVPPKYHDLEYTTAEGVTYTMASIDAMRLWALDGDQPELDFGEPPSCFSQYGLCE